MHAMVLKRLVPRALSSQIGKTDTFPPMLLTGYCSGYPDPQQWYSYMFQSSSTLFRTGWTSAEFDQGEGDNRHLDQQREQHQAQPGSESIGGEPPDREGSGTIATQRLAGRRAE